MASDNVMIDLRSDTVTRPSAPMRAAISAAEVGDDILDGDPTTRRLEQEVARILGKEGALFFPSGTMANQASVIALAQPGTELLLDADAHMVHMEHAGIAANAGVQIRTVKAPVGAMTAAHLRSAIRPPSPYQPRAGMISVENSFAFGGGAVTNAEEMRRFGAVAAELQIPLHLDGARLWNAAVATGESPETLAKEATTVAVSFSKGLGAPVGAAVAASGPILEKLWAARRRLGGGMRQSGILASACLYGLLHNYSRLAEDHANARQLAAIVARSPAVVVLPPETNIVMVDLPADMDGDTVAARCRELGVLLVAWSRARLRMVTHLDVSAAQVQEAGATVLDVLKNSTR